LLFTPYAEYWGYDIASQPEWLMASLWYKAEGGQGMFILGDPGTGNFWSHLYLPDTAGKWMHMLVVGERPPVHNVPILRNLGAANVWFQDVQVRAVNLQSAASSCRQEICVRFTQ